MNTFVLISKYGEYAIPVYRGGGFGDKTPNLLDTTTDIDAAFLFNERVHRNLVQEGISDSGFVKVPAYEIREVRLGVKK